MKWLCSLALLASLACCGCNDKAGPAGDDGVEVEVNKTPDLDPSTDADVDVEVD